MTNEAPTLLALLEFCTYTRKPRVNRMAVLGMCVALLLKFSFHKMCLVQKIISLILYAGHSGKQVNKHAMLSHASNPVVGISTTEKSECTPSHYHIGTHSRY